MSPPKRKVQPVPDDVDQLIEKMQARKSAPIKWSGANGMPCTGYFLDIFNGQIRVKTHIGNTSRPLTVDREYIFWDFVRSKL